MEIDQIIEVAQEIWKTLGPGFSESVYHNAFEVELRKLGVRYETERVIPIVYKDHTIGSVRADIIIDNSIVIELKSVSKINELHQHQVSVYMHHGPFESGVIINFPVSQAASISSWTKRCREGTHGE